MKEKSILRRSTILDMITKIMKQTQLFTKTQKETPKDERARNAQLLIQAGFVYKEMAGVYTYLPLGLRVLKKIENIIREEMNAIGGQEMLMTTLQSPEIWEKSSRWSDEVVDIWFKTKLKNEQELGLANTHEEPLANILKQHVSSYKDIPLYIYQIQTKFRNELRAKSGIMRGREFLMKDLYSFNKTEEEFRDFYEKCADAYERIFARVGIGDITYRTLASGGSFTTGFTDEFQTLTQAGEDTIYISKDKKRAINKEIYNDENISLLGLDKDTLEEVKSVEVGNIFPLGTKYPEAMGLTFKNEKGKSEPVIMGSYGIGLGRLMGAVAEILSDDAGLVWPKSIAPFDVHVLRLTSSDASNAQLNEVVKLLEDKGLEVLVDDRETSAGQKFADADLIGIPWRVVVSDKTAQAQTVEIRSRTEMKEEMVTIKDMVEKILQN